YLLLDIKTTPNGRTPQAATMVRMDIQPGTGSRSNTPQWDIGRQVMASMDRATATKALSFPHRLTSRRRRWPRNRQVHDHHKRSNQLKALLVSADQGLRD
ncbi:MAG TPA: hypothetical protein VFE92_16115, partial [Dermatophilaceae bacterium]|nr:hypothetical protein [Dermatophilaceae bacterium]